MKKILLSSIITILAVSSCLSLTFADSIATTNTTKLSQNKTDKMTLIARAHSNISISSSGSANVIASVTGNPGTTKTEIISYLQQYRNGTWTNIATFTASGSQRCNLSKYKTVTKGYKYRVSSVVRAYKGTASENRTVNSSSINY